MAPEFWLAGKLHIVVVRRMRGETYGEYTKLPHGCLVLNLEFLRFLGARPEKTSQAGHLLLDHQFPQTRELRPRDHSNFKYGHKSTTGKISPMAS